jgi:hypothetical protein
MALAGLNAKTGRERTMTDSPVFSETLETRRLWDRYLAGDIITTRDLFDFARKMESERNKIHAALVKLDGIYHHDLDHPAHRPDWLRDALSLENA